MSDDLTPRDIELASAELDGQDLGPARAIPSVVDALARLRAEMADVPPVADDVREAAIAAALAAFDAGVDTEPAAGGGSDDAGAPAERPATVTPVERLVQIRTKQRRAYRWLGAAAAAAIVGVVAVGVLRGSDTSNDSASKTAERNATPLEASTAADSAAATTPAAPPTISGIPGPAGIDLLVVIDRPEDLVAFAHQQFDANDQGSAASTPPADTAAPGSDVDGGTSGGGEAAVRYQGPCDLTDGIYVGEVQYQGIPAIVVDRPGAVDALDASTCQVLAHVID